MRKSVLIILFLLYFTPLHNAYAQGKPEHPAGHGSHGSHASQTSVGAMEHNNHDHERADSYGPIGVMGSHVHEAGTFMPSYRFMYMDMRGNLDGTSSVSRKDVLKDFMVSPTSMQVEMHMFGGMYSPTDNFAIIAMLPYVRKSMRHVNRMGVGYTTRSDGIGDFKLMPLYEFFRRGGHSLHFNAGVGFPTGSIDKKDDTPTGPNQRLPYPMQLGSGTFDLLPGITYLGQVEDWSWGVQPMGTIRLGKNSNDYRLGNRFHLTAWGAREWASWLSTSVRIDGQVWGNIHGDDPDLNPAMVPTADPDRQGGRRVELLFGANLYVPKGRLKGQMLAIEGGLPIYQSLDGPQLETDWRLTVGWRWAF